MLRDGAQPSFEAEEDVQLFLKENSTEETKQLKKSLGGEKNIENGYKYSLSARPMVVSLFHAQ